MITAEDVGAYKPAEITFVRSTTRLTSSGSPARAPACGAEPVPRSRPGQTRGLPSVWINRHRDDKGWGATPKPAEEYSYNFEFGSMGDLTVRRFDGSVQTVDTHPLTW